MNAGDATDIVLYRTRSTGGFAFAKAWVRDTIISLCHNTINASLKRVLKSATWTLTPDKPIYDLDAEFTDCHEVVVIRDEDKKLSQAKDFKELFGLSLYWSRTTGLTPKLWSQIGHHFLAVYPQPSSTKELSIIYVKDLPPLTQDSDLLELPDEDIPFCLDLAEIVLLISQARGGKLVEVQAKVQDFAAKYGMELPSLQDRSDPKVGE